MTVIKTQWVQPANKPGKRFVDIDSLKITDDKYTGRRYTTYRYDALFGKLKYGQSIQCNKGDASTICNAMRDYLKRKNKKGKVRSVENWDKTTSRVWLMEE
jgi:hypothetical protein